MVMLLLTLVLSFIYCPQGWSSFGIPDFLDILKTTIKVTKPLHFLALFVLDIFLTYCVWKDFVVLVKKIFFSVICEGKSETQSAT